MLVDLLSTSNYISCNIELAKLLGLHTAIYLNELININIKAVRKDKITDHYFTIDRTYIESRTTIKSKEQIELDKSLQELGILQKTDVDTMLINLDTIASMLMSSDEDLRKDVKTVCTKAAKKKTKSEAIKDNLKSNILATNEELLQAYTSWIDSVIDRNGWMTKQAVLSAQSLIDSYAQHNLDVALKLLEIASINGWRDINWAITDFEKKYKHLYLNVAQPVQDMSKLGGKVFK